MARQKLRRFAQLDRMDNVVDGRRCQPGWFDEAFDPDQAVVLELGCGRGEYTLAQARSRPNCGCLGVDRNGARLWKGATAALDEGLTNAVFLCAPIEGLEDHVPPGRVTEIWIPFPDPLPKNRQARHRLVSPLFLDRYRQLLCRDGAIHLKTDDPELVEFAERAVRTVGGRVRSGSDSLAHHADVVAVQTEYEKKYRGLGRTIYSRQFCLD